MGPGRGDDRAGSADGRCRDPGVKRAERRPALFRPRPSKRKKERVWFILNFVLDDDHQESLQFTGRRREIRVIMPIERNPLTESASREMWKERKSVVHAFKLATFLLNPTPDLSSVAGFRERREQRYSVVGSRVMDRQSVT